jgi:hypothetical protein
MDSKWYTKFGQPKYNYSKRTHSNYHCNVTIDQTTILAGGKVILSAGTLTIANGTGTDFIIAGIYERTSISTSITISAGANISCSSGGLYTHKVAGGSVPTIT